MLNYLRLMYIVVGVLSFSAFVVLANPHAPALIGEAKSESVVLKPGPGTTFALEQTAFTFVPPDRVLTTVGDTLYMLNSKHQIIWKEEVGGVVGQPFVMPDGSIHVLLAQDKLHVVLDGGTGKTLKCIDCHTTSRTSFTQVLPYSQNQYLVVESSAFLRQNNESRNIPDALTLWEGEIVVWSTSIPPNARVHVVKGKILTVEKNGESIIVREVVVSKK